MTKKEILVIDFNELLVGQKFTVIEKDSHPERKGEYCCNGRVYIKTSETEGVLKDSEGRKYFSPKKWVIVISD